ncbi:MAG: hypothetical protein R3F34_10195 [Planctomycetota bacterium]
MSSTVRPDSRLRVRYSILDTEGNRLEGTEDDEYVVVELGADELPEEVETALVGQPVGGAVRVEVEEPFGPVDPTNFQAIPRDAIDGEIEGAPGDLVPLILEPESPEEGEEIEEIEVRIVEVNEDGIVVDLNHPFAGMDLVYEVLVVGFEEE